jgi:hypothetical protein
MRTSKRNYGQGSWWSGVPEWDEAAVERYHELASKGAARLRLAQARADAQAAAAAEASVAAPPARWINNHGRALLRRWALSLLGRSGARA